MRKVVVQSGNILTSLGNLDSTWTGLLSGSCGLKLQGVESLDGSWPLGIIPDLAGPIGSFQRHSLMLEQLLSDLPSISPNTRLICTTTKGAIDELIDAPDMVSGQPWEAGVEIARMTGISGAPLMVSGACASGTIAAINGAIQIMQGECDHVLVVGFDLISKFVLSGFDSLKALSSEGARPFDQNRNGLSLGDGAGWILLSAEDKCQTSSPLATIESWGISCDATHITAPCRNATGLKRVLVQVDSKRESKIGAINAHGTGTIYNDAMELLAFDEMCEKDIPVCSVKGSLGHSLAATGLIEILLSTRSLRDGVLPPTVGLTDPAESSCNISGEKTLNLIWPSVLTTNSGFGGINSAVLLAK